MHLIKEPCVYHTQVSQSIRRENAENVEKTIKIVYMQSDFDVHEFLCLLCMNESINDEYFLLNRTEYVFSKLANTYEGASPGFMFRSNK